MGYYFSRRLQTAFEEAIERIKASLKQEGFGIITEIDIQKTLKEKIGVDFRKYRILGACKPQAAYQALQAEDKIGTMLPCNVIVQEHGDKDVEIAAIDPIASMQAVKNPALEGLAKKVQAELEKAVNNA
ncbi:MAG: DUF302 domain-containing protein [Nitrospiraceae bacterium]|nr:DUF302 domain-containing protein [Nitrospiraceae bacterium]